MLATLPTPTFLPSLAVVLYATQNLIGLLFVLDCPEYIVRYNVLTAVYRS